MLLRLQLLWKVDQGEALDVSGIPDAAMRSAVMALLSTLPLRRTKQVARRCTARPDLVPLQRLADDGSSRTSTTPPPLCLSGVCPSSVACEELVLC